jgi:hypothetical protein
MAERRPDHDEWNIHKDEIHKLYIEDDEKLSDVAVLMAQQHDFKRTYVECLLYRIKAYFCS